MDEWDKANNSADQDKINASGSDAGRQDSANDIHIENDTHQTPPYTQYASYQGPYGSNGGYQQNPPYQSPYQYNQAPAGGGKQGGDGSKKKKKTGLIILIVILCIALIAAGIGIAIGLTRDKNGEAGENACAELQKRYGDTFH